MPRSRSQDDESRPRRSTRWDVRGHCRDSTGRERIERARQLALLLEKEGEVEMSQAMLDSNDSVINSLMKGGLRWIAAQNLQKDKEIEAKNADIAAKVVEIGMKDGEISERDGVIAHQEGEIRSKDNVIYRLKALVASKDAEIGRRDGQIARMTEASQVMLASKDSEIGRLKGVVDQSEREIASKDAEIGRKDAQIARLMEGEMKLEREVNAKKGDLARKDGEIARLREQIERKDGEIARRDGDISELKSALQNHVELVESDKGKDVEIARLTKVVVKMGLDVKSKDAEIAAKNRQIDQESEASERKGREINVLIAKAVRNDEAFANLKVSKTKLKQALKDCTEQAVRNDEAFAESALEVEALKVAKTKLKRALKDSTENAANLAADMGRLMTWKDAEIAGKNDEISRKDEAIGRKEEEIKALKAALEKSRANIDTVDLTNEEEEPPEKRKRATEPLSVTLQRESNQRLATVKQEKVAAEVALEDVRDDLRKDDEIAQKDEAIGRKDEEIKALKAALENSRANTDTMDLTNEEEEPPGKRKRATEPLSVALQRDSNQRLARVKREKVEAEAALEDVRDDLGIANDTLSQQAVFTDAWQTKFDEVAEAAAAHGVDGSVISGIRNRSVV